MLVDRNTLIDFMDGILASVAAFQSAKIFAHFSTLESMKKL